MDTGVQVKVLVSAEIPMPHGYVFRAAGSGLHRLRAALTSGSGMLRAPCLSYVVWHPSAGVILIDTGLHPDALTDLRKDFGLAMGLFFRSLEPASPAFDAQLRALAVEPGDVTRVVMTHLHADHTSGMRLLPRARFVVTADEWRAAHSRLATTNGYVGHHLPARSSVELVDYAHAEPHASFSKTLDLLGDGSVRLISTPGHTAGHQSVLLRRDDGRAVLLAGDAAYTLRSIDEQALPALTADDDASRESLRELGAFTGANPEAVVVPTHDPEAWRRLG